MRPMIGRLAARLPLLMLLLCLAALARPSFAQEDDGLLPVTEAYKLSADAATPGVLKLHWEIAPDYYLYRGRMKFRPADGVSLGEPTFPEGEKHHDEYLGDVETYHHAIDASVPYTVAPGTKRLRLEVQFQGCHEVDPKICYPPHTQPLDLPLPAAVATSGGRSLGAALRSLGATRGSAGGDTPLPAGQAFKLEALAQDPHHLLLRWTMPPGATRLRLGVQFQGCHETDPKICYPPSPTTVTVNLADSAPGAAQPASPLATAEGLKGTPPTALNLGGNSGATDATPLPPEQAFVFEAIAQSP
ncbi:MAG TPA: protein-disulfide reductase DsbD domain-containing protein, partial [Frateuria sp.]|uniref:protein-disulfide reductase DsbD domain-containing protein n=1 Tax=Frateuria sp. TaxID=2211372 RepID=UPI002D808427